MGKPAQAPYVYQPPREVDWHAAISDTVTYYEALWYYWVGKGRYVNSTHFNGDRQAKVHVYSLALIMYLWDRPHYRSGTFGNDLRKNLRNTAIPGTGIPLSAFCYFKFTAYFFLVVVYPLVCFAAALHARKEYGVKVSSAYREQLLNPRDWFSFWRLNCALASYHALETGDDGYRFEDKWTFLTEGQELGVAVSPWLTCSGVVAKHRNEEGGLAYFSYRNAADGGDWIIQEHLKNAQSIGRLLPANAPLSTLRIVTGSTAGLHPSTAPLGTDVTALSCVFRAGRAGALTDHSSILFDVDMDTGMIKQGTTNAHWYQLGRSSVWASPWVSHHDMTAHPDTGTPITGECIPDIGQAKQLCVDAHQRLASRVPLVGWDVAITSAGMVLLEVCRHRWLWPALLFCHRC